MGSGGLKAHHVGESEPFGLMDEPIIPEGVIMDDMYKMLSAMKGYTQHFENYERAVEHAKEVSGRVSSDFLVVLGGRVLIIISNGTIIWERYREDS